jgi:hypothetical protein
VVLPAILLVGLGVALRTAASFGSLAALAVAGFTIVAAVAAAYISTR